MRSESFGGLLFSRASQSILELSPAAYRLLREVDGLLSLNEVVQRFCGNDRNLEIRARSLLEDLKGKGFLG